LDIFFEMGNVFGFSTVIHRSKFLTKIPIMEYMPNNGRNTWILERDRKAWMPNTTRSFFVSDA